MSGCCRVHRKLYRGVAGYLAAKVLPAVYADYCVSARQIGFNEKWKVGVAIDAYQMADAMLAARKPDPQQ